MPRHTDRVPSARQFIMNRGKLLTYDLLLERLWDSGGQFVDKHALAVNVNRLRGKIEDKNHRYIQMYMGWDINGLADVYHDDYFICSQYWYCYGKTTG